MPAIIAATWAERFWTQFFRLFSWLERQKKSHPAFYNIAIFPVVAILSYVVVAFLLAYLPTSTPAIVDIIARAVCSLLCSLVIFTGFTRGLLPILAYAPQAIALREMGLARIAYDPDEAILLTKHYADLYGYSAQVRVICISGRHLFREERVESMATPLHDLAIKGRLDVLMPTSTLDNITIAERLKTYRPDFARASGYDEPKVLLDEIKMGKEFLRKYGNNVAEHPFLCMWRVVIFSGCCVVQNYFPNASGDESYKSPTFFFEKRDNSLHINNYYQTFSKMFEILKARAVATSAQA